MEPINLDTLDRAALASVMRSDRHELIREYAGLRYAAKELRARKRKSSAATLLEAQAHMVYSRMPSSLQWP